MQDFDNAVPRRSRVLLVIGLLKNRYLIYPFPSTLVLKSSVGKNPSLKSFSPSVVKLKNFQTAFRDLPTSSIVLCSDVLSSEVSMLYSQPLDPQDQPLPMGRSIILKSSTYRYNNLLVNPQLYCTLPQLAFQKHIVNLARAAEALRPIPRPFFCLKKKNPASKLVARSRR